MSNKMIEYHFEKACEIALRDVEEIAKNILLNPEYEDICNYWQAMGSWRFTDSDNNSIDERYYYKYPEIKKIEAIMDEWNRYLKLTGVPVHLYWINGEVLRETNW